MFRDRGAWRWGGVVLLFLLARLPLHLTTFPLPLTNDDAIPLLMARYMARGELATTPWNEPYNGTLDAVLLAPATLTGSSHHLFRVYQALCGALLVAGVAWLARRAGGDPLAPALLAAVAPPYVALMAALGPVPNFVNPLLLALAAGLLCGRDSSPGRGAAAVAGLAAGLAAWNSATAVPAVVGVLVGRLAAGSRLSFRALAGAAAGFVLGCAPAVLGRLLGAAVASPVTAVRPPRLWADGIADLGRAASGLLGLEVPLVIDGPERSVLPLLARIFLAAGLGLLVVLGARERRRLPLLGWTLAVGAAFALSRRSGGDEVRYLFSAAVPLLALAGQGLARMRRRSTPAAVLLAGAVLVPWAIGHVALLRAWRDPAHAAERWQVPDLRAAVRALDAAGVSSAYASLQFAGRLAVESSAGLVASQAWNERFPGEPLRFRDEVDLDPAAAWVLHSRISRGLPRAAGFREILDTLGGRWTEAAAGDTTVFHSFAAPFDETRPLGLESFTLAWTDDHPLPPAVVDRDGRTTWTSPLGLGPGAGLVVRFAPPRRVSALVLGIDLDRTPLGVPWVCEADGVLVARGPQRHVFQWVGGVPRAGRQALLTVTLPGTTVSSVRLLFQAPGPPLVLSEVFLYGPDAEARPAAGTKAAGAALAAARANRWSEAVRLYEEAAGLERDRASYHAALARARRRAGGGNRIDVESLDDGGPALVGIR